MTLLGTTRTLQVLDTLHTVVAGPPLEIAGTFSEQLKSLIGHSALLILTADSTGRPRQKAGHPAIADTATRPELEALRRMLATEASDPWGQQAVIGGSERPVIARTATTGALLVLTDPELTASGAQDPESTLALVDSLWQIVATSIRLRDAAAAASHTGSRSAVPRADPLGAASDSGSGSAWDLSPREQDVFVLVASGARNKAIAAELSISENTVKFHVANLLRKAGATTRTELAALAG